jgi:hypothetical protein
LLRKRSQALVLPPRSTDGKIVNNMSVYEVFCIKYICEEPHGVTYPKTAVFILTAVKTSNLTYL